MLNRSRSIVHAPTAAAATSHPLATLTAIEILRRGGNAVDAAIAAVALQGVVESHQTGIGGDCFALYMPRSRHTPIAINGSGPAPAASSVEWYGRRGFSEIPLTSPHAVTIPGAVATWARLSADHGVLPWSMLLEPAIDAARLGYAIQPCVAADWAADAATVATNTAAAAIFLPDGRPPGAGAIHRQPRLAQTLERIARDGRDGFYKGSVATDIVGCLSDLGGLHTLDDLAGFEPEYVEPISSRYRGCEIFEMPPNGQGLAALMMLNALDGYDLGDPKLSAADRVHLLAEIGKQAYFHRDQLFADPHYAPVPVAALLSSDWAAHARGRIDMRTAAPPTLWPAVSQRDTVYVCVVDREGNAISLINSLFHSFGSGIMAPHSGVLLHNRGAQFSLVPGHPNAIAGGKRPMHTLAPGMVVRDGSCVAPFGVMGGPYQAAGQAELLCNILDRGLDIQSALDAPRSFSYRGILRIERHAEAGIVEALRARGHDASWADRPIGGGQIIWRDAPGGPLAAASDHRQDGCALGY